MKIAAKIILLALLTACSGPADKSESSTQTPPKPANEQATIDALSEINKAQKDFFVRNRRYALTYDELIESFFMKSEPSADATGYEIKLRPAADAGRYAVIATPLSATPTTRHFFTDESGDIRAEQGRPANAQSPKIT